MYQIKLVNIGRSSMTRTVIVKVSRRDLAESIAVSICARYFVGGSISLTAVDRTEYVIFNGCYYAGSLKIVRI